MLNYDLIQKNVENLPINKKYNNKKMATLADQLTEILGVAPSTSWSLVDAYPEQDLYLVNYNQLADMTRYGRLHGVVVDMRVKKIIARSYNFTPYATLDKLVPDIADQHLEFRDDFGNFTNLAPIDKGTTIYQGIEGKLLTIFKHNGNTFYSVSNRLTIDTISYNGSPSLGELYIDFGGPKPEELFDQNKKYASYCHHIMICSPYFLKVSKEMSFLTPSSPSPRRNSKDTVFPNNIELKGYLVYIGTQEIFDKNTSPYSIQDVEFLPTQSKRFSTKSFTENMRRQKKLSLTEANKFLETGYHPNVPIGNDLRTGLGEFIVLYQNNVPVMKVYSPAYSWRLNIRDNNPNIDERFFELTNAAGFDTKVADRLADYEKRFPIFEQMSIENFNKLTLPVLTLPTIKITLKIPSGEAKIPGFTYSPTTRIPAGFLEPTPTNLVSTRDDRLYNIFLAYFMALPLHLQFTEKFLYEQYLSDRADIIQWLQELYLTHSKLTKVTGLNTQTLELLARVKSEVLNGFYNNQIAESFDVATLQVIRDLVPNEEGSSLYQIYLNMKQFQHETLLA